MISCIINIMVWTISEISLLVSTFYFSFLYCECREKCTKYNLNKKFKCKERAKNLGGVTESG